MSTRTKKRLRLVAVVLGLLVVGWLGSASFVAWRLTHRFHARSPETIPEDLRTYATDVRLTTRDAEDLGAWWLEGSSDRPVVVLMHGLGGCRSVLATRIRILARGGFPMLAVSLRAHGDSSGETTDAGWSSRADVMAAVAWVEQHRPGSRIVLDGASMGAAAAMFAAGDLGERVDGYILECPYRDLKTAIRNRVEFFLPPGLSHIAYAGLMVVSPVFLPEIDRIAPVGSVGLIPAATPVLILASSTDTHAVPDEARDLLARLDGRGELVFFADAAHDRLVETHPEQWGSVVTGFLERVTSLPRRTK